MNNNPEQRPPRPQHLYKAKRCNQHSLVRIYFINSDFQTGNLRTATKPRATTAATRVGPRTTFTRALGFLVPGKLSALNHQLRDFLFMPWILFRGLGCVITRAVDCTLRVRGVFVARAVARGLRSSGCVVARSVDYLRFGSNLIFISLLEMTYKGLEKFTL